MNYEIMFDYGSEGYNLYKDLDNSTPRKSTRRKFETIGDAVKFAVGLNYTTRFIIVEVKWEPTDISKLEETT